MDTPFETICSQVSDFARHVHNIVDEIPTFDFSVDIDRSSKKIQLRASVNLFGDVIIKFAEILHYGEKWRINGIHIEKIEQLRSLYLPFVFKKFQLGILDLIQWAPEQAAQRGWSYSFLESTILMYRGNVYQNAVTIVLTPPLSHLGVQIRVDRTDDMCTTNIRGQLVFDGHSSHRFESVGALKAKFAGTLARAHSTNRAGASAEDDNLGTATSDSQAIWTAIDKLATMMTYKLPGI